jgi:hypothetical protein
MIENGDFEGGFYRDGDDALLLGNGWKAWWQGTRPEWKPNTETQWVHSGTHSQKIMLPWHAWEGGIWQRVEGVTSGAWYTLSGWLFAHTAADENPYRFQSGLGINPYGNDPADIYTHWWKATWKVDEWKRCWCTARAFGDTISVCVRGSPSFSLQWNDLFIDDLELVEIAGPGEEPPEEPPEPPPTGDFDWDTMRLLLLDTLSDATVCEQRIREIVREQLDNTRLIGATDAETKGILDCGS